MSRLLEAGVVERRAERLRFSIVPVSPGDRTVGQPDSHDTHVRVARGGNVPTRRSARIRTYAIPARRVAVARMSRDHIARATTARSGTPTRMRTRKCTATNSRRTRSPGVRGDGPSRIARARRRGRAARSSSWAAVAHEWAAALAAQGATLRRARPLGRRSFATQGAHSAAERAGRATLSSRARSRCRLRRTRSTPSSAITGRWASCDPRRTVPEAAACCGRAGCSRPRDASARVPHVERCQGAADPQAADRLRRARRTDTRRGHRSTGPLRRAAGSGCCASTASTSKT